MRAVSTFWLCSDQASTAEYSCQSHNEASCNVPSPHESAEGFFICSAVKDDSLTRAMDRTMTLPLLGINCQNKSRKFI